MGSIANELITRGWTQGQSVDDEGRVCFLGAAAYSNGWLGPSGDLWCADQRLADAFTRILGGRGVARWNDAPERTFDEVLRAAKQVDELLDAQT